MNANQNKNNGVENIRSLVSGHRLPGIQYMVVDRNSVLFSDAAGQAIIDGGQMTLATPMMMYSATKVITAVALLQLVDQKKLSLNDPLVKYLPQLPYRDVSIRQVLTHSSGIPNPVIGNMYVHNEKQVGDWDRRPLLEKTLEANKRPKFAPGKKFSYSNLGFALLGVLIEVLSGKSYETFIVENILQRLGISKEQASFSFESFDSDSRGYIKKYSMMNLLLGMLIKDLTPKSQGRWKTFEEHWYFNFPSHGGLIVSAPAVAIFLQDQLKEHSVLLSDQQKQELYRVQRPAKSWLIGSTDIALSWFYNDKGPEPYYFHEGSAFGYVAEMRLYPRVNIGSVLLANVTRFAHKKLMTGIDSRYF